jgi:hypothetical protein
MEMLQMLTFPQTFTNYATCVTKIQIKLHILCENTRMTQNRDRVSAKIFVPQNYTKIMEI